VRRLSTVVVVDMEVAWVEVEMVGMRGDSVHCLEGRCGVSESGRVGNERHLCSYFACRERKTERQQNFMT